MTSRSGDMAGKPGTGVRHGMPLHDLTLRDHADGEVRLDDLAGVTCGIILLPGAFTPVCTRELPGIDRLWRELGERDVPLLVAACDAPPVLAAWRAAEGVDVPLLSDFWPHGELARRLDAFDAGSGRARRVSAVVDAPGALAWREEAPVGSVRDLGRLARALTDR